jgi:hypothetical protein
MSATAPQLTFWGRSPRSDTERFEVLEGFADPLDIGTHEGLGLPARGVVRVEPETSERPAHRVGIEESRALRLDGRGRTTCDDYSPVARSRGFSS